MNTRVLVSVVAALLWPAWGSVAHAAVTLDLADQPLYTVPAVAGNLALPLSVEYPTAVSVAHLDTTYNSASTYLGYFDPNKCYAYVFVDVETSDNMSHFAPAGVASTHQCVGADNDHLWSGNYLNWATTQTIDPFRWAMTGGYRVVDTPTLTLLEKAWASGQGGTGNFPDKVVNNGADIAAATPFLGTDPLTAYVQGRGQKVNFVADGAVGTGGFLATYFNTINLDHGSPAAKPVLTRTEAVNFDWGGGSPKPGVVNADGFSARWVTSQTAPSTGTYTFQTYSDDGVRLWVNGQLIIDHWTVHGPAYDTGTIKLDANQPMNIRLEYFDNTGGAAIKLNWKRPGDFGFSNYKAGDYWYVPIRVKVCDPDAPGGLEANCVYHASGNYKPEGLMQQYANKVRYSVFGYLNDGNVLRDGGVLRAEQKFIGPTYPIPGSPPQVNPQAEWDADTGVQFTNPDPASAAGTTGVTITNSGALNYINKFGEITRSTYKTYDPVSELYYASLRYLKNQGNVDSWTSMAGATDADKATWADGFPVITSWRDPIQYTCQKNYILGIGDVHTHGDKNVPGPTSSVREPVKPGPADGLMNDTGYSALFNAVTATNKVGELQGMGAGAGTKVGVGSCCAGNSYLMAGLAYDAHTRDIRPDLAGVQTVQTYWLDVLEYQSFETNNPFYLAAKFGGFTVPDGFAPYQRTTPLDEAWWHTTKDTVGTGSGAQPRPDNYFTGGRPDQMVAGLTSAFVQIVDNLSSVSTAGLVTASPNQDLTGVAYGSSYSARSWTGTVTGDAVTYSATDGKPVQTTKWDASTKLDDQAKVGRVIVTCCKDTGAALPFTATALSTKGLSSRTNYNSFAQVPGVVPASQSAANFLAYLRGSRTLERGQTNGVYRKREHLMGDIVDSKILAVGAPEASYFDRSNPDYSTFKKTYRQRKPVVYAGTNNGVLHAIDGRVPDGGAELFAYIPSFMYGTASTAGQTGLAALGSPGYVHANRINGPLRAVDVNFNQTYGVTSTTDKPPTTGDWRTVLVGGLGKGGKGYFALDITNPDGWNGESTSSAETTMAQKVLWEFPAAPERANDSNSALASSAAASATMGYSYGEPQIVKTAKYGWVVLLPSGYNTPDGIGHIYVVDVRTGALLEQLDTPEGDVKAPINLAKITAYIPDDSTALVEAVYGADMRGNVWRFDLSGTGKYEAPTKIAVLTNDQGKRLSVTAPIRVAIDKASGNKRYILIGTGRLLADSDISSTEVQRFFVLVDGDNTKYFSSAPLPGGVTFPLTPKQLVKLESLEDGASKVSMGWYMDLTRSTDSPAEPAYRVTVMPQASGGYLLFAANQPGNDPCAPSGKGRLYILALSNGKRFQETQKASMIGDIQLKSVDGLPVATATDQDGNTTTIGMPGATFTGSRLSWRESPSSD